MPCVEFEHRRERLSQRERLPRRFGLWPRRLLLAERPQSLPVSQHRPMRRLGPPFMLGGRDSRSLRLRGQLRPRLLLPYAMRRVHRRQRLRGPGHLQLRHAEQSLGLRGVLACTVTDPKSRLTDSNWAPPVGPPFGHVANADQHSLCRRLLRPAVAAVLLATVAACGGLTASTASEAGADSSAAVGRCLIQAGAYDQSRRHAAAL
jgi:hypothetical protein